MSPQRPKLKRVAALVVASLLLPSCEREPPPKPPSLVESANPLPTGVADVRLGAAEPVVSATPVVATQAPGSVATPTRQPDSPVLVPDVQAKTSPTSQATHQLPVQISQEPASAAGVGMDADLQALREAMARQADVGKSQAEAVQSALAALGQRLAQLEARPASQAQASRRSAQDTKAAPKPTPPRKPKNPVKSKNSRHATPAATTVKPKQVSALPHHSAGGQASLPFAVASVDTWDGEKQAVVRVGNQWIGLKAGNTRDGWRIESMDGQAVTVRSPQGDIRNIEAGQGE
jgi:hypothetical protein